ncbi:hypothetical protein [Streptomyces sp. NPDC059616]
MFERGRPRQGTGLTGEGLKVVIQDEPWAVAGGQPLVPGDLVGAVEDDHF